MLIALLLLLSDAAPSHNYFVVVFVFVKRDESRKEVTAQEKKIRKLETGDKGRSRTAAGQENWQPAAQQQPQQQLQQQLQKLQQRLSQVEALHQPSAVVVHQPVQPRMAPMIARPMMAQPVMAQPVIAQPVMAQPMAPQQTMLVQVPPGLAAGMMMQIQTAKGMMQVQVPQGMGAGSQFQVMV